MLNLQGGHFPFFLRLKIPEYQGCLEMYGAGDWMNLLFPIYWNNVRISLLGVDLPEYSLGIQSPNVR